MASRAHLEKLIAGYRKDRQGLIENIANFKLGKILFDHPGASPGANFRGTTLAIWQLELVGLNSIISAHDAKYP